MQGFLYKSGGILSMSLAGVLIALSAIYTMKLWLNFRVNGYLKALTAVLILVSVYGFVAYLTDGSVVIGKKGSTPTINWFKTMYMSILPVFTYTYFVLHGYLSVKFVRILAPFLILSIIGYYYNISTQQFEKVREYGAQVENITNNAGYSVLSLMPILLAFDKKKLLQFVGLICIIVAVTLAMKRGAIFIGAIMSLLFISKEFKESRGITKSAIILLIFLLCGSTYMFISDYMMDNDYFLRRMNNTIDGNSSGRDDIYATLWEHYLHETSILKIIFGGGIWYTTKISWTAAHNDWLEFLLDMGALGVVIFAIYWIKFFQLTIFKKLPANSRFCLLLIFVLYFLRTIFSMSISAMTYIDGMMLSIALCGLIKSCNICAVSNSYQRTHQRRINTDTF